MRIEQTVSEEDLKICADMMVSVNPWSTLNFTYEMCFFVSEISPSQADLIVVWLSLSSNSSVLLRAFWPQRLERMFRAPQGCTRPAR